MKIISSQHYLDWQIVEQKMKEIESAEIIEIPCCEIGEIDGVEYAVQTDRHHTLAAARELGMEVEYLFFEDEEGLTGERYLESHYMDGDWYDVEKSNPAEEKFLLIWQ